MNPFNAQVSQSECVTDQFGNKRWYDNGQLHRKDGPAVERADGRKEWWLYGRRIADPAVIAKVTPQHTVADGALKENRILTAPRLVFGPCKTSKGARSR